MHGQTVLADLVHLPHPCRRRPHALHGGQQETDQDGEDGDHH
jgi:hypothetical protein